MTAEPLHRQGLHDLCTHRAVEECIRCINFSCPVIAVPKPLVDAYLRRNPLMREAWEASGAPLEPVEPMAP